MLYIYINGPEYASFWIYNKHIYFFKINVYYNIISNLFLFWDEIHSRHVPGSFGDIHPGKAQRNTGNQTRPPSILIMWDQSLASTLLGRTSFASCWMTNTRPRDSRWFGVRQTYGVAVCMLKNQHRDERTWTIDFCFLLQISTFLAYNVQALLVATLRRHVKWRLVS